MTEVTYLNEIKFRNAIKKHISPVGIGHLVNKTTTYLKSGIHVDTIYGTDLFKVRVINWGHSTQSDLQAALANVKLTQELVLAGFEMVRTTEMGWDRNRVDIIGWRKAESK